MAKAFESWQFAGVRFLSFPIHGVNSMVVDDLGTALDLTYEITKPFTNNKYY